MPNQTVTIFDYPFDRLPVELQRNATYYDTPILDTVNWLNSYTADDFKDVRMPGKAENDHRLIVVSEPQDGAEFSETVSHIILELTHYGVPFMFVQVPLDNETRTVQKNPLRYRTYESLVRFSMKKYGVIPEQFETGKPGAFADRMTVTEFNDNLYILIEEDDELLITNIYEAVCEHAENQYHADTNNAEYKAFHDYLASHKRAVRSLKTSTLLSIVNEHHLLVSSI